MSHVDDGTLHTYLDGALDSLGSAEAERVRKHLASCEECTGRLQKEAALRDEVKAVLASAAPEVGDLPSFEDIRARAATTRPASVRYGIRRLAWAASMVLALGTGWMLRGASVPGGADGAQSLQVISPLREEGAEPSLSPTPVATTPPAEAEEAATRQPQGTDARESRQVAAAESVESRAGAGRGDAAVEAARVAEAPTAAPEQKTTDSVAVLADRTAAEAPSPTQEAGGTRPEGRDSSLVGVALPDRLVAAERLEPLRLQAVAAPGAATVQAARELQPAARDDREPAEAEGRSELPRYFSEASQALVVPGLEVISVSWLTGADLDGAVRVLQRIGRGDTLELIHLPPGIDPGSMPPVPADGRTEVVLPRGAGWLVARARLARQDLEVILRELTPGRR